MICSKCKGQKFHTRYVEEAPKFYVCDMCRSETPFTNEIKGKKKFLGSQDKSE